MIITISGVPGAGKTSTGGYLARTLGYKLYSMGDLHGKIALEMGITIDELMRRAKTDKSIHERVDEYQRNLGQTGSNYIFDGWLSFHWMPRSIKILLTASPRVAAERVFEEQKTSARKDEKKYESIEETLKEQKERFEVVRQSFISQYGVDILRQANYDLMIDTSNLTVEQTAEQILQYAWSR